MCSYGVNFAFRDLLLAAGTQEEFGRLACILNEKSGLVKNLCFCRAPMRQKLKFSPQLGEIGSAERAAMFDNMSNSEKMHAMNMAGHDMSKMSHKEKMDMIDKLTPGQKAEMFDKMPMDTKMSTMRMSMKEHGANRTGK